MNPARVHVENLKLIFGGGEKQYFGAFDRTYQDRRTGLSDRNQIVRVGLVAENFLQTLSFFRELFHVFISHRLLGGQRGNPVRADGIPQLERRTGRRCGNSSKPLPNLPGLRRLASGAEIAGADATDLFLGCDGAELPGGFADRGRRYAAERFLKTVQKIGFQTTIRGQHLIPGFR